MATVTVENVCDTLNIGGSDFAEAKIQKMSAGNLCAIFAQAELNPVKAKARLNYGSPETSELTPSDLIAAADKGLIRPEEFRKNAVKFGWELWDVEPQPNAKGA